MKNHKNKEIISNLLWKRCLRWITFKAVLVDC